MQDLDAIVGRATAEFAAAPDPASLENAKAKYLGKSGELTGLMKQLGSLQPEERKAFGQKINAAKQQIEAALDSSRKGLESKKLESRLAGEALDVTLPGRGRARGGLHPITRTWQRTLATPYRDRKMRQPPGAEHAAWTIPAITAKAFPRSL